MPCTVRPRCVGCKCDVNLGMCLFSNLCAYMIISFTSREKVLNTWFEGGNVKWWRSEDINLQFSGEGSYSNVYREIYNTNIRHNERLTLWLYLPLVLAWDLERFKLDHETIFSSFKMYHLGWFCSTCFMVRYVFFYNNFAGSYFAPTNERTNTQLSLKNMLCSDYVQNGAFCDKWNVMKLQT